MELVARRPVSAGVVAWPDGGRTRTIVLKITWTWRADGRLMAASKPDPLNLDVLSQTGAVAAPSDFAPYKPRCDILVVGTARSDEPATVFPVRLSLGSLQKTVYGLSDAPTQELPLTSEYLRSSPTHPEPARLGPLSSPVRRGDPTAPDALARWTAPGFDFAQFNVAPADQQIDALPLDVPLALEGAGDLRPSPLPRTVPEALVVWPHDKTPLPLDLRCDTLIVDSDRGSLIMVWRAVLRLDAPRPDPLLLVCPFGTLTRSGHEDLLTAARSPVLSPRDLAAGRPAARRGADPLSGTIRMGDLRAAVDAALAGASEPDESDGDGDEDEVTNLHAMVPGKDAGRGGAGNLADTAPPAHPPGTHPPGPGTYPPGSATHPPVPVSEPPAARPPVGRETLPPAPATIPPTSAHATQAEPSRRGKAVTQLVGEVSPIAGPSWIGKPKNKFASTVQLGNKRPPADAALPFKKRAQDGTSDALPPPPPPPAIPDAVRRPAFDTLSGTIDVEALKALPFNRPHAANTDASMSAAEGAGSTLDDPETPAPATQSPETIPPAAMLGALGELPFMAAPKPMTMPSHGPGHAPGHRPSDPVASDSEEATGLVDVARLRGGAPTPFSVEVEDTQDPETIRPPAAPAFYGPGPSPSSIGVPGAGPDRRAIADESTGVIDVAALRGTALPFPATPGEEGPPPAAPSSPGLMAPPPGVAQNVPKPGLAHGAMRLDDRGDLEARQDGPGLTVGARMAHLGSDRLSQAATPVSVGGGGLDPSEKEVFLHVLSAVWSGKSRGDALQDTGSDEVRTLRTARALAVAARRQAGGGGARPLDEFLRALRQQQEANEVEERGAQELASLRAKCETALDPEEPLRQAGISFAEYRRAMARLRQRTATDPAYARAFAKALAAARAGDASDEEGSETTEEPPHSTAPPPAASGAATPFVRV